MRPKASDGARQVLYAFAWGPSAGTAPGIPLYAEGGDLSDDQRQRLGEIASRCPIHRTLTEGVIITHRS
ncbi:MAG: hypothetical protein DME10_11930 [Candidatus Rokuibacteriota bacterium]|nr:MAG: hypothetical protein DME10_11930 [Candidatus Rokubacteria bacterium]